MKKFWFVKSLPALIVLVSLMTPITFAFASKATTLLNADSNDLSHFSQSKHERTGKVNFLVIKRGYAIQPYSKLNANPTKEQVSRSFLSIYGKHFGLKDEARELVASKIKTPKDGRSISRFKQVFSNIPVYGGELVVDIDADNNLRSINGNIAPDINVSTTSTVTALTAQTAALNVVAKSYQVFANTLMASKPELIIFNASVAGMNGGNETLLAWKCVVSSIPSVFEAKEPIKEQVIIDAKNEKIINHFNLIAETKNRSTYDLQHTSSTPVLSRAEGQANIGDLEIDNAHNFAGDTYDFYKNEHNRDSINNSGMALVSKVRYSTSYCNAYWNGVEMTYGDGCFIVVDDIVAHELTHGVTQYESNLIYQGQSGAINEAFSDIWGEFVDLSNSQGNDAPSVRWLMGEDTSIGALRNMKNPPEFQDPDRVKSSLYYCGTGDNGGVHYNSGVANKAAYLITDGDTFNGYTITGLGLSKTADLFYEAQSNILISSANYNSLYAALNQACTTLNYSATECQQVSNAGLATEMNLTPCQTAPCVASTIEVNTSLPEVFTSGLLETTDCGSTERSGSYQDVITFPVTVGKQYVITMNSTAFDTYLYLFNDTTLIASDDDGNGGTNSKIIYTATASGSLTIHTTSYNASATGAYQLAVSTISTAKLDQTLTFGSVPTITVGETGVLSATASSGLAVIFTSATPSICTVSGSAVTGVSIGNCSILANQAGNSTYNQAAQVSQIFTVRASLQSQAITFGVAPRLYVNNAGSLSATASSGLAVTFSSATPSVCSVSGSTVTGVSVGNCRILANQVGNSTYNQAPQVSQTITVMADLKTQTITFGAPQSLRVYRNGTLSATASSGLAVTFSSATPSVCYVIGSRVTGVRVGNCRILANQAGNSTYKRAPQVSQAITVR